MASVAVSGQSASDEESFAPVELVRRVRQLPGCHCTPIVVFIEQNGTGNSCGYIGTALRKEFGGYVTVVSARQRDTPGVVKTFETTREYGRLWRAILNEQRCCLHSSCITYKNKLEQECETLESSFNSFRYEPEETLLSHKVKWTLTAKTAARSDDMFISLIMIEYWKRYFWNHPERYRDQINKIRTMSGRRR